MCTHFSRSFATSVRPLASNFVQNYSVLEVAQIFTDLPPVFVPKVAGSWHTDLLKSSISYNPNLVAIDEGGDLSLIPANIGATVYNPASANPVRIKPLGQNT